MAPAIHIPTSSLLLEPKLFQAPRTVDELVRSRAVALGDAPLVAYPKSGLEYVDYSARQLNVFAQRAAEKYDGITPRMSSSEPEKVVALLATSNLDYLVTAIALSRLGMTVLFLSTRISDAAHLSLLENTGCNDIVVQPGYVATVDRLRRVRPELAMHMMVRQDEYAGPIDNEDVKLAQTIESTLDPDIENSKLAWIIHSSGSTGLPKPIFQTHSSVLKNYSTNFGLKGFVTLPLFHAHGLASVFRAIDSGKQIWIYNADLPLTRPYMVESMKLHPPEIFYGVPYALKLLAETEEGVDILRKCKIVMFGGSSCPDVLGDRLVKNGVNLVSHYGSTETGQLMTSFREDGDLDWNYVKLGTSLAPYVRWEEQGEGTGIYELVVMPGWPSKVATNREDGGYSTKDLFIRHPTKKDRFKYCGRKDDTITLVNGEKANPIPIEHTIRENPYVSEVLVFGNGKAQVGALVIPAATPALAGMDEKAIIEKIWPSIEAANRDAPSYAQLAPEAVKILPPETEYPRTDKGTIIRAAFIREFAPEIESVYAEMEATAAGGGLELGMEDTKTFVRKAVTDVLSLQDSMASQLKDDTDFFALGMDSLQATRARMMLQLKLATGGKPLPQNIVFEKPTINQLSHYLYDIRTGAQGQSEAVTDIMSRLIEKYSNFPAHTPGDSQGGQCILLTGSTGSLGAHIVAALARRQDIQKVYCFVRGSSAQEAHKRTMESLRSRRCLTTLSPESLQKIRSLPADLGRSDFGLDTDVVQELRAAVTTVIHCAWAVNFNLGIRSFEGQHINGTYNLINFCLSSTRPTPPCFNFCSSVSAIVATPGAQVAEATETWLPCAQNTGYARSKLVTENICALAAKKTGMASRVLRIGQIVGDTVHGIWHDTEAIPLMVRSALTIGALPTLDEDVSWLPVDVVGETVVDLSLLGLEDAPLAAVFNVVNPTKVHWTKEFLPALEEAGMKFDRLSPQEWLERLRHSEPNPEINPPIKLIDFWTGKYGSTGRKPGLTIRTDLSRAFSPALRAAPKIDSGLGKKFVRYWLHECQWSSAKI